MDRGFLADPHSRLWLIYRLDEARPIGLAALTEIDVEPGTATFRTLIGEAQGSRARIRTGIERARAASCRSRTSASARSASTSTATTRPASTCTRARLPGGLAPRDEARARRPSLGCHPDGSPGARLDLGGVPLASLDEPEEVEVTGRVAVGGQHPGGVAQLLEPVRVEVLEVPPQRMAAALLRGARPVERLGRQAPEPGPHLHLVAGPALADGGRRSGSRRGPAPRPRPGTRSGPALVRRRRQLHSTSSSWTSVARRPSRSSGAVPGQVTPGALAASRIRSRTQ